VRKFSLAAMPTVSQLNLKTRKILFALLLALICIVLVYAAFQKDRPWVVPEEVKKLKNPLTPSESTLKAAKAIYTDECAQCHGEHGKGDGPEAMTHSPAPADLTDARQMNSVSDGEIFYQISEGRKPMPSFKKRLTEDQRWGLVLFVRSFSQPSATTDKNPNHGKDTTASSKGPASTYRSGFQFASIRLKEKAGR
jgi:mono/diheme cytochrome c family protein